MTKTVTSQRIQNILSIEIGRITHETSDVLGEVHTRHVIIRLSTDEVMYLSLMADSEDCLQVKEIS